MSEFQWPAGKTFGELTAEQRRAATQQAARQLGDELTRMAPAIAAVLDEPDCICTDSNLPARKDCPYCYPNN